MEAVYEPMQTDRDFLKVLGLNYIIRLKSEGLFFIYVFPQCLASYYVYT